MIDCHVHLHKGVGCGDDLMNRLSSIGGKGAIVLSLPPENFPASPPASSPEKRLDMVKEWCAGRSGLYPFFWLDPTAADAAGQVEICGQKGIAGFKVTCDRFYSSDAGAMNIFRLIAETRKPVLFHSGILWDGRFSSKYNRPVEFECLLEIPRLRFALAHIAWPWCDELLAVYGKFQRERSEHPETAPEMFIDTTPGTPEPYREPELRKLYTIGYDLEDNLMFGTDGSADDYCSEWSEKLLRRDKDILKQLALGNEKKEKYFYRNAERFVCGK